SITLPTEKNLTIWLRSRGVAQLPAGDSPVTESARPRRPSSIASQPPSELPTRWALAIRASSRISSVASAIALRLTGSSAGSAGPKQWPGSVGANTSYSASSALRTGRHTPQLAVTPWRSTSGVPVPPRYWADWSSTGGALIELNPDG